MASMDCIPRSEIPSRPLGWLRMARITERVALVAIPVGALLAASCGGGQTPDQASDIVPLGFPITAERADGQELAFDSPTLRIVSLSPGHTEILFAIGAGDQVIAVDTQSNFPQETEGKTKFDAMSPDVEAVVGLNPDLVVVMAGPDDVVQSLDQRGLQVLWLELPDSLGSLFDQIDLLGEITGHRDGSDSLVEEMDIRALAVLEKVGATVGPSVYHELDDELRTASSDTFTGELYLILSATNIAGDSQQLYPQLALDAIVEADPEVIIVAYSGASPESVKARSGWQDISAVKDDRIYAVDPDTVNRPGPRLVDGLEALAGLLHPDLFP